VSFSTGSQLCSAAGVTTTVVVSKVGGTFIDPGAFTKAGTALTLGGGVEALTVTATEYSKEYLAVSTDHTATLVPGTRVIWREGSSQTATTNLNEGVAYYIKAITSTGITLTATADITGGEIDIGNGAAGSTLHTPHYALITQADGSALLGVVDAGGASGTNAAALAKHAIDENVNVFYTTPIYNTASASSAESNVCKVAYCKQNQKFDAATNTCSNCGQGQISQDGCTFTSATTSGSSYYFEGERTSSTDQSATCIAATGTADVDACHSFCPVNHKLVAQSAGHQGTWCDACAAGKTRAAGDKLCSGPLNSAGLPTCSNDAASGTYTGVANGVPSPVSTDSDLCATVKCPANHFVQSNKCVECPAGKTRAAGLPATLVDGALAGQAGHADNLCTAATCGRDFYVEAKTELVPPYDTTYVCTACPAGKTNAKNDPMDTPSTCTDVVCPDNHYLVPSTSTCRPCPSWQESQGGVQTQCTNKLCPENNEVTNHVCQACPTGKKVPDLGSTARQTWYDASGWIGDMGEDRSCENILCLVNQRVSGNACLDCDAGKYNAAGDSAAGADTFCTVDSAATRYNTNSPENHLHENVLLTAYCAADQHVVNHKCVACPADSSRPAGDDPNGQDTQCTANQAGPAVVHSPAADGCTQDQHVQNHACVDCPQYYYNEAGDDPHHTDTACKPVMCPTGWRVDTTDTNAHVCKPCNPNDITDTHLTVASAWVGGSATYCR
jgi:hypothetical protein